MPRVSATDFDLGGRPRDARLEPRHRRRKRVLFFCQFRSKPRADFSESMHVLIDDPQVLGDNLIRELYCMGAALEQKYPRLQIAYAVFLLGIISSIVLFALSLLARRFGA